METQSSLLKLTARLTLVSLIVIIMVVGKEFLVPFTWSLLIGLASVNLLDRLHAKTRIPMSLIIPGFLILLLVVIFLLGYFFYFELSHIFADLPSILAKLSDKLHSLSQSIGSSGIPIPEHIDQTFISEWVNNHNDTIVNLVSAFGIEFWNIILVIFYLFFLLYYKDLLPAFFTSHIKDKRKLVEVKGSLERSMSVTRGYMYGLLIITGISAVMNLIVFMIFGLEYGLFFAVFLAVLNLIPFIGNPIGLAVIMLFAFITKDNIMIPIFIIIALFAVGFVQDNVIRPWLLGDKIKLNAFTVFVAIIIGGMIWGVSGMILFIPIVGIMKIFIEGNESTRNYAIFFSELNK